MVPPWVSDEPPSDDQDSNETEQGTTGVTSESAPPAEPIPIAPPGRFAPSRVILGEYARSGSPNSMRRGLGHYIKKGLGGAGTAVRRFGGTIRTAGRLYTVLSSAAAGESVAPDIRLDLSVLAGRTANEIIDALVEGVRPFDGTQDGEASRAAIRDALSELLNQFPDADLLNLSDDQRLFVIERYVADDVYNRFHLDVGKTIQDKASTATAALARLKEVKDYIKEVVAGAVRRVRTSGRILNVQTVTHIVRDALRNVFEVFEDYVT